MVFIIRMEWGNIMYCEECGEKLGGGPHKCKQAQPNTVVPNTVEPRKVIPKVEKTVTLKKRNLIIGIAISGFMISAIVILVGLMLLGRNTFNLFSAQTDEFESIFKEKDPKEKDFEEVEAVKGEGDEEVHSKKEELEVLELKAQLESQDTPAVYMAEFDQIGRSVV